MDTPKKEYPDKYWNCLIELKPFGGKKGNSTIKNDLTFAQLKQEILEPWHSGNRFAINGLIISDKSEIQMIKIAHSTQTKTQLEAMYNQHRASQGVLDMVTDRRLLPLANGQDYTNELIFTTGSVRDLDQVYLVLELCKRIKKSASIISNRPRKGKESYKISDEYDVQDLLHSLLRGVIKYSVHEDPISKLAGTKSSRADISIEELGILIEVKYVRSPDDQKRLVSEYSQDLVLYTAWPHLKTLIYLVYNSDDLADPEALEKLSGPQEISGKRFESKIVLS